MNSPVPGALCIGVIVALGVLYLFARFPILDRILDSLRDRYESWVLDRDIRRAFKEAQKRGLIDREWRSVRDRYPRNGESQL